MASRKTGFAPLQESEGIPRVAGSEARRKRLADVLLGDIVGVEARTWPENDGKVHVTWTVSTMREGQRTPRQHHVPKLSLESLLCEAYGVGNGVVTDWLMPELERRFSGFREAYDSRLQELAGPGPDLRKAEEVAQRMKREASEIIVRIGFQKVVQGLTGLGESVTEESLILAWRRAVEKDPDLMERGQRAGGDQ